MTSKELEDLRKLKGGKKERSAKLRDDHKPTDYVTSRGNWRSHISPPARRELVSVTTVLQGLYAIMRRILRRYRGFQGLFQGLANYFILPWFTCRVLSSTFCLYSE